MDDIKSATDELNTVWSGMATKMYDTAKTEEAPKTEDTEAKKDSKKGKKGDDEIEDADF